MGQGFTLGHFVSFIFRFSVIYFNYSSESPENFSSTKKVLSMLRKLEVSDTFIKFLHKLNRTYSGSMSFLPSKILLSKLMKNEGIDHIYDLDILSKEEIISAIFNGPMAFSNFESPPHSPSNKNNKSMRSSES